MEEIKLPPAERAAKTAIGAGSSGKGTVGTYLKADALFSEKKGTKLDFGSGRGEGAKLIKADTYEPYVKSKPKFNNVNDIKSNSYNKITSLNVLNVLPPEARNEAVKNIGRILKPNGEAIVSTRGVKDVESAKNKVQIKDGYIIGKGDDARFQKGFTATELKNYVQKTLGKNFTVENVKGIGKAAVKIKKLNIPKGFGGVTRQEGTPVIDIQEKLLFNPRQKFSSGGDAMDNEMLSFSELERFRKENDYYHDSDPRNPMNTEGMDLANPEVQKKIIEEINDRKKLDVISEMPISRKAGQRIKERRLEEALEKGKALKINKGGSIPQQMEMFSEGGLKDEGNTIDPVSGNEVPPGATQEEVRDDIPAQLSEGEFVFPADVVRYIGLEKLMMMRQEAKAGLARMEAMGQMGNADEATLPDDIPFTLDDLDTREETEDDVIKANIGTFVPPKFPTSQPYNPNVNPYQPTGVVPTPYMPYRPAQAEQILQPAGSGTGQVETELRRYVNKETGQVRMIPFNKATGTSLFPIDSLIQQGFVREDETPKAEAPKTTKIQTAKVQPVDTSSSDGMPDKTGGAVDATGISLNRGLIKNENLTNFLNTVTPFEQFKSTFKGPIGAGIDRFALGVSPRTKQYEMGVVGGVLDSFRGGNVEFKTRAGRATGKYNDITKLHEMNEDRQNQIGIVGNAVVEIMKPVIYDYDTKTKQYNKKSDVEITKSLKAKADILGIPTTYRGTNIRNTTLARDIAKKLAEDAVRINDKYGDTTHAIDSLKAQENRRAVARNEARAAETFKDSIPTSFEPGDYDGGDGTDVGGGEVSFVGDDPAFKQGGLVSKKKPKVKKMKRGGLASR